MSDLLVSELLRFCKANYGVDLCHAHSALNLWQAEWCLLKTLVLAGRAAMAQWFKELAATVKHDRPRAIERDGVRYEFVGYRPKTLHGLFGTIRYQRAYYASGTGKGCERLKRYGGLTRARPGSRGSA